MEATNELKKEHRGIELMLRILNALSDKSRQGKQIPVNHLNGIMEFLSIFVDKCHHAKEEEFLFPALEAAGVQREGGPIGVLLNEHEQGRKIVETLKETGTRYTSGEQTAAPSFQLYISEYVTLLTQHIEKEENIVFDMADNRLDPVQDKKLLEAFEKLESERIGPGKHEEFHAMLHRLEHEYLV